MDRKPEEFSLEYAGFWIRLGASLIDLSIILSLIYSISSIIIGILSHLQSPVMGFGNLHYEQGIIAVASIAEQADTGKNGFILITAIAILITALYVIGMWYWQGQTLGKMVTGIKIIRTDSSPLTFSHAAIRFLGCILCTAMLGIGFLWISFDSRKQGIHDKIADTYVVKLPVRQVIFTESYIRSHVRQA